MTKEWTEKVNNKEFNGTYNEYLRWYEVKLKTGEIEGRYDAKLKDLFNYILNSRAMKIVLNKTTINFSRKDMDDDNYIKKMEDMMVNVMIRGKVTTNMRVTVKDFEEKLSQFEKPYTIE